MVIVIYIGGNFLNFAFINLLIINFFIKIINRWGKILFLRFYFKKHSFRKVCKFVWHKGAEDDDMSMRVIDAGYKITRPTNDIGRYKMILHNKRTRALNR